MYALISKLEPIEDGLRICGKSKEKFDVTQDLFWVDCSDDLNIDENYYHDNTIKPRKPIPGLDLSHLNESK
jgi:hypothetical protein